MTFPANRVVALVSVALATLAVAGCESGKGAGHAAKVASAQNAGGAGAHIYNLITTGIEQAEKKDLSGASATFKQVLALEPDNKFAWFNLGVIAQGKGDSSAATDYSRALQTDPSFTPALYNKALVVQSSDPDEAIRLLRRAISVNPKASTSYLHLGLLLKAKNDPEAADDFAKAVALDPTLAQFVPAGELSSVSPSQ